jgi:hypothetical protein
MKALLIRISIGVIALGALLYVLACAPGSQNTNTKANQTVVQNTNTASGKRDSKDLKPCSYGSDPIWTGGEIKRKIKDKMSAELKKELKDDANPNGTFTLEIKKADQAEYFIAYVTGKISGDDNLKDLGDILNDFQDEEFCLRVVYLRAPGGPSATTVDDGFPWFACEHPLQTCPNGVCSEICPNQDPVPSPTPPTGNSNSNSNGNTNK